MSSPQPPARFDALALGTDIQRRIGVKTVRNRPLAPLTTMRVGGPADLFVEVHNAFELRGLARFARARGMPHFLIGRGSDLVISDRGIRGLVIHVRAQGLEVSGVHLMAEAGVPFARAATEAQRAGLSGLEFGLAIPGTIGGAVWANAGAHDSDVAAVLASATILLADGREARLGPEELGFGYRDSRFKHAVPGSPGEVILAATFRLSPSDPEVVKQRLDEIRRWRRAHQPLGLPSAGSVFRNPPTGPSAGELIERAGLKGYRIGGVVISEMHANWIVNDSGGSAADVRALAELARDEVARRFGVQLDYEVQFVGEWGEAGEDHP